MKQPVSTLFLQVDVHAVLAIDTPLKVAWKCQWCRHPWILRRLLFPRLRSGNSWGKTSPFPFFPCTGLPSSHHSCTDCNGDGFVARHPGIQSHRRTFDTFSTSKVPSIGDSSRWDASFPRMNPWHPFCAKEKDPSVLRREPTSTTDVSTFEGLSSRGETGRPSIRPGAWLPFVASLRLVVVPYGSAPGRNEGRPVSPAMEVRSLLDRPPSSWGREARDSVESFLLSTRKGGGGFRSHRLAGIPIPCRRRRHSSDPSIHLIPSFERLVRPRTFPGW